MRRLFPLNPVISMASVSPQLYAFLKWKNKTRMSLPKCNVILQRAQICENIWFVPLIWLFQAKRNVLVIKIIVKVSHNLKQFQSVCLPSVPHLLYLHVHISGCHLTLWPVQSLGKPLQAHLQDLWGEKVERWWPDVPRLGGSSSWNKITCRWQLETVACGQQHLNSRAINTNASTDNCSNSVGFKISHN